MSNTAEYSYPAILADLKAKHPGEDHNRLAAAAGFLYRSKLAIVDQFGRIEYAPEARPIAPRCFPPPQVGSVDAETMQRFLDGRVAASDEIAPPPKPRPVPAEVAEADALEARYAAILDAMSEGATMFDRRENARRVAADLAARAKGDGSDAVQRAAANGANGHQIGVSR